MRSLPLQLRIIQSAPLFRKKPLLGRHVSPTPNTSLPLAGPNPSLLLAIVEALTSLRQKTDQSAQLLTSLASFPLQLAYPSFALAIPLNSITPRSLAALSQAMQAAARQNVWNSQQCDWPCRHCALPIWTVSQYWSDVGR